MSEISEEIKEKLRRLMEIDGQRLKLWQARQELQQEILRLQEGVEHGSSAHSL
ncbi:MAG: hypothetical protein ACOCQT_06655 [Desulfovermiculus sp.]